jgi:hypothetical protein
LNASELLAIDVAEELRALSREQLQGSWQIPAELVRLAVARGASKVELVTRRHGFEVRCDAPLVTDRQLRVLAAALDPGIESDRRHTAVVELEGGGVQALLWLAGEQRSSLDMTSGVDALKSRFMCRTGGAPIVDQASVGSKAHGFELHFGGSRFDGPRARGWLRRATRFAPISVSVDGHRVPSGFVDTLAAVRTDRPVPADIAITRDGDAPHLYLLRDGVLATRATVPGYPPFEAAVELGGTVGSVATPDDLRAAVNPALPELIDLAVRLMVDLARQLEELDEASRERVTCLVLRAARGGLYRSEIFGIPLLRAVAEDGPTWLSLAAVADQARRGRGVLRATPPDRSPPGTTSGDTDILLLTTEECSLLAELLDVRLERPAGRQRPNGLGRLVNATRVAAEWCVELAPAEFRRQVVPSDDLLDSERELLVRLNRQLPAPKDVRICTGGGAVRRRGRRLLLPRHNPLVVQAVRLVARDDSWLYPVALALLGRHATPTAELRARWRRGSVISPVD